MKVCLIKQRGTMPFKNRARLLRVLMFAQELAGLGQEKGVLNVILTPSAVMAEMNEEFLEHQGRTDVLTFDLRDGFLADDETDACVAEVYVCPDVAVEYSAKFGTTPSWELVLYMVHGMLHLAGEDDLEEEARLSMRKAEKRVMDGIAKRFSVEGFIGKET